MALRGFSLIELVAALIIAAVLAAVLAPRFIGRSGFSAQTTADQLLAAIRYAEALTQNQGVPTSLTVGSTSFSVTQTTGGVTAPVANPSLQPATFVVALPAGVTVSPAATVTFNRPGAPFVAAPTTFMVTGGGSTVAVYVTASGYAYECRRGGACPP